MCQENIQRWFSNTIFDKQTKSGIDEIHSCRKPVITDINPHTQYITILSLYLFSEQPIPPPRGCILVHKSGACCPYLQCSKLHLTSKNSGDRKKIHFLDYYEKEAEERLTNPNSYLRRSDDDDIEENGGTVLVDWIRNIF